MSRYSVSERIFIVRTYYSNNNSPIVTQRKFATEFKLKTTGSSVSTTNRLIQKFERTCSVCYDMFGNVGRPLSVKTPEKIERTRQVFERSPRTSIRKAAQQVGIKRESVRQIVVADLQLFPYKIQIPQRLSQRSVEQRLEFANTIVEMIDNDQFDVSMLWCSDEAHFHLDGYVNRQNWCIWGTEKSPLCNSEVPIPPTSDRLMCAFESRHCWSDFFRADCQFCTIRGSVEKSVHSSNSKCFANINPSQGSKKNQTKAKKASIDPKVLTLVNIVAEQEWFNC
ncbi:hypothetical protein AVEN_143177-1 [Araneus ventricosus]|uniref:DUF4817 domain-containing protein n=1 Tax=Araneus ventricosus TaxID=182803 RepID=A0A4Y2JTT6_ARAVE|nr:hypothetical protein AVEN_143177-1 [Araneus ventricosus]